MLWWHLYINFSDNIMLFLLRYDQHSGHSWHTFVWYSKWVKFNKTVLELPFLSKFHLNLKALCNELRQNCFMVLMPDISACVYKNLDKIYLKCRSVSFWKNTRLSQTLSISNIHDNILSNLIYLFILYSNTRAYKRGLL